MKVLITTGGSGGHIFPALQVGLQLKERGHEVIFAGALAMAIAKIRAAGFEVVDIPAQGINGRSPVSLARFTWRMFKAFGLATALLKRVRPSKVIGFGGYGSFAVIAAAWVAQYPSLIHEQNVVPGKANRLMSRLVKKIVISFKDSAVYFPVGKTVWAGCPCHSRQAQEPRDELLKVFELSAGKKTILILGGSQGSQRLNEVFFNVALRFAKELNIQAIHMTGALDFEQYRSKYQEHGLPVKVFSFIELIEQAYAVADVVVARAGASTVSELGLLGKPSVLVPYPFAGNHQKFNAQVLVNAGTAVLLEQKDLDEDSLKAALLGVLNANLSQEELCRKAEGLFNINAADRIASMVEAA